MYKQQRFFKYLRNNIKSFYCIYQNYSKSNPALKTTNDHNYYLHVAFASSKIGQKMKGWQIHSYGDIDDELQLSDKIKCPTIKTSNDVLIKVKSSGVNPIDIAMINGYGTKLLNVMRCNHDNIEFPLTFGREFCGEIAHKGMGLCSDEYKIGDIVWGVVPVHKIGCHAEYVVVPENCITKKPNDISVIDAGGILYAGLTAWSGIFISGLFGGIQGVLTCLNTTNTGTGIGRGKNILVLGASGGVGSSAIQILKAENATVIATCSTDAISIVKNLGADHVIDYTNQEQINDIIVYGPYDIILDCAGLGQNYANQFNWSYDTYVTFSSPLLQNIDDSGLIIGMIKNTVDVLDVNIKSITNRKGLIKWGYFIPSLNGIKYLKNLIERKKFLPLIDSIYEFKDAKEAYKKVKNGHLRGKVIIDFEKT